ncbi:MAG: hypothetical protein WKF48_05865 [Solirubrobacteraceae bacterium]
MIRAAQHEDVELAPTRKQQLVEAFRRAGRRGLTGAEMTRLVGVFWRLRLRELGGDGFVFHETPKRYGKGVFRWTLVSEPRPGTEDHEDTLFEPPPAPPSSAIGGDPEC